MLNWVSILRRILKLYRVKTQGELSLALGVPVNIGQEKDHVDQIPWQILELVVSDKKVTWDWLLTGGGAAPNVSAGDPPPPSPPPVAPMDGGAIPSGFETRALERSLLGGSPSCPADDAVERLETLRATMEQEIDRIEKRLGERHDS